MKHRYLWLGAALMSTTWLGCGSKQPTQVADASGAATAPASASSNAAPTSQPSAPAQPPSNANASNPSSEPESDSPSAGAAAAPAPSRPSIGSVGSGGSARPSIGTAGNGGGAAAAPQGGGSARPSFGSAGAGAAIPPEGSSAATPSRPSFGSTGGPAGNTEPASSPASSGATFGSSPPPSSFASTPPQPIELTLRDRAVEAFRAGNAPRAYALMQAHSLHLPNDEIETVTSSYRWDKPRVVPRYGYNFAVGLVLKKSGNVTELKPVGTDLAALGGGGGGRGGPARGGAPSGGAASTPIPVLPAKELSDAAGKFASKFIDAFRSEHSEGKWSEAFREYDFGASGSAPSGGLLGGFLSSTGGLAGGMAGGTGGPGRPGAGAPGGAPPGYGPGAGGPPAGYTGGGSGGPPGYGGGSGGPPSNYRPGGTGAPPGYGGGGPGGPGGPGAGGPPAGYNPGSTGAPPGYGGAGGGPGGGGPPAGYNPGSTGAPPGYGGAGGGPGGGGPPAGYNPGSTGAPPGYGGAGGGPGGAGGPPAGGGAPAGNAGGGSASGSFDYVAPYQDDALNITSGSPGAAPTSAPPGFGNAPPGAGFAGAGFGSPSSSAYPADLQLPSGSIPLGPGLVYIGSSESLADLAKKATEQHYDALVVFEVDVAFLRANGTTKNDCRIRVVNLQAEKGAKDKSITSSSLNAREVAADKDPDGKIQSAVDGLIKKMVEAYPLSDLPNLPADSIKNKRLPALVKDTTRTKLDLLGEVQLYFGKGLIDETTRLDVFGAIAGPDGRVLATGTEDEKLAVLEKMIRRDFD